MDYNRRIQKVKKMMEGKADYLIVGPSSNMLYLTGFVEEPMERPILLVLGDRDFMLAPRMYMEQLSDLPIELQTYNDGEDPYSYLNLRKGASLVVDDSLWSAFLIEIVNRFLPSNLLRGSVLMKKLRAIKDREEIEIMMEGLGIAEASFHDLINMIKEGETECEVGRKLEMIFAEHGVVPSFSTISTSGPNTSMPHLRCTDRRIRKGDIIIVDFGVKYRGYSTDTTRVLSLGSPSKEVMEIWSIVDEAVNLAEKVQFGLSGREIDNIPRKLIEEKGYGKYFIHRTGHGIGIDVHEDPYISSDNLEVVERGSTFTIEPGIYIPGRFGIRLEDMVIMNEKINRMNSLSRELYVI
ncbi:aminopeptidase P family protein [Metallosphaera tengchongensis]|uniref:Aminopeptidase P family protein n=1 Tax=Metallosphaera tengchongensis TaxID=1532350 RepID=A0A6N0NY30_9CREN|nr:aminopeptidase P family protein [Metallosphaera tengchongensis]QKR00010.1 aminopeptidase P family protein [Metallosphaera tengchongensis]